MEEPKIQHLIVLMMENRSFDHLLGYLEYPPEKEFEGLKGKETKMVSHIRPEMEVYPSMDADFSIFPGPDHSHEGVMEQLLGANTRAHPYQVTNRGFAMNYEKSSPGSGRKALQCFSPEQVPVLSKLAMEFAVCDHWFCSVPGETWPNRSFAHAGTSDGEVNIRNVRQERRLFENWTIFEELSNADRDWAIYYSGFPPHTLVYPRLWSPLHLGWLQRFRSIDRLFRAIQYDRLPHYSFVEPDMMGKISDSQHPGMGGEMDFKAGERLIWRIYDALRQNQDVFNKTMFLITYDEHGGFFDHVTPPQGSEWSVKEIYKSADYEFKFDLLGPRVPAVIVSPWIEKLTVDHEKYDHASIPATVMKLLDVEPSTDNPLGDRVARAETFDRVLNRQTPRDDLPEIEEPFVNEASRKLVKEKIDLRESMIAIIRDLIWTHILEQPTEQLDDLRSRMGYSGRRGPDEAKLSEEIDREIRDDILTKLSPQAQQVLSEAASPPLTEPETRSEGRRGSRGFIKAGIQRIVRLIKYYLEKLLEDMTLIDDAGEYVEQVLHRYFEAKKVVLRTVDGRSFEQPRPKTIEREIQSLFDQNRPGTSCWLADYQDRWLTLYPDGRARFQDRRDQIYQIANVTPQSALRLFQLLSEGRIESLKSEMKLVSSPKN